MHLSLLDIFTMLCYLAFLMGTAQLAAAKAGHSTGFSGGIHISHRANRWWFIGISLLISGLSAEQILGLGGAAYAMGITVATYDWTAAIALLLVGKYLLPILHRNQIGSVPEFLCRRYGPGIQILMGCMWLCVTIFVKLTAILWLGAIALHTITGFSYGISLILIGLFAGNYALYVGLKADAFGNLIQILATLTAGSIFVWFSLCLLTGENTIAEGLQHLRTNLPGHFHMVLPPEDPNYIYAPGLGMLLGGMWVLHISYWGGNQTIFRRTLECETVRPAQNGLLISATIKLIFPFLVVLPGIIALQLIPGLSQPDAAIPALLAKLPHGLLGIVFSVLIVSVVVSMGNELSQIAAILTDDLFDNAILRLSGKKRHILSHIATFLALILAICLAQPLLGRIDLAFMYIQEMMGFLAPGVLTLFAFGLIWRHANAAGALAATIGAPVLSALAKIFWPGLPFINRIGWVFLCSCLLMVTGSWLLRHRFASHALAVSGTEFATSNLYNMVAGGLIVLLAGLYTVLW